MKHKGGKKGHLTTAKMSPRANAITSDHSDGMAHSSHHQANMDHGTPQGFAPPEGYQDGGSDHHLGDNCADED